MLIYLADFIKKTPPSPLLQEGGQEKNLIPPLVRGGKGVFYKDIRKNEQLNIIIV